MEQYGRRDNIKVFGVPEQQDEDPWAVVVNVAAKIGVTISKNEITVAHRLPSRRGVLNLSLQNFFDGKQKPRIMTKKKLLKVEDNAREPNIYVNDDITPLRAKSSYQRQT